MYHLNSNYLLQFPPGTSKWLSPKNAKEKKSSLYVTAILNCEFSVSVLLSMQIHVIHTSNT
jgi:hypothetical protein